MQIARVRALSALVVVVLFTTACSNLSGPPPAAGGPAAPAAATCNPNGVTLTTAYISVGDPAMQTAKKVMEQRYPGLKVEATVSPARSYDELTQRVVADIAAGRKVDVVQAGNSQLRFYVDTYKPKPIDVSKLRDTYDRRFLNVGTVDGQVYLVPFQVSVPVLFYNKDLMAKAGLNPEQPPTTYTALFAAARALKPVSKANSLYVLTEGAADWIVQAAVQSAGETFIQADGTPGFDTPRGRASLELYSLPAREGLMDPIGSAEGSAAFNSGSMPLYITSSASGAGIAKEVGSSFQWGVTAMPIADGGTVSFPAGGNGWMILTDDACRAGFASELIAEMYAPEVIADALRSNSYIPVDSRAKDILLADTAISENQKWSYRYTGTVTQWGGWRGSTAPEANKVLTTLTQSLANKAPLDSTVSAAAAQIRAIAPAPAAR